MWLTYNSIADHTGYTPEECHEICKGLFLKKEKVNEKTGTIFQYVASTTELTTTEFSGYVDSIIKFASEEFGITLPLPNEQLTIAA